MRNKLRNLLRCGVVLLVILAVAGVAAASERTNHRITLTIDNFHLTGLSEVATDPADSGNLLGPFFVATGDIMRVNGKPASGRFRLPRRRL